MMPSAYYWRMHPKSKKFGNVTEFCCWSDCSIIRILQNKVYYGAVVGHKREQVSACSKHTVQVAENEQIVVEDMYPGIVTKDEFMAVQKRFRKIDRKEGMKKERKKPLLMGKAVCGVCGRQMHFRTHFIRGKEYSYILCTHARHQRDGQCCRRYSRETDVNEVIWQSVKKLMDAADDVEEAEDKG